MIDLNLYNREIRCQTNSMISGKHEELVDYQSSDFLIPILQAFLDDNDIQEITVCSTNIGFVKTYAKSFKKTEPADVSLERS